MIWIQATLSFSTHQDPDWVSRSSSTEIVVRISWHTRYSTGLGPMAQGADTVGRQDARDHDIKQDMSGTEIAEHVQHHEMRVIPLEEEAVQDNFHIELGWRSWVRIFLYKPLTPRGYHQCQA